MKSVQLRKFDGFDSTSLMKIALEQAPAQRGLNISEISQRIRVIDAIGKLDPDAEALELEDADFKTLKAVYEQCRWAAVRPEIVQVSEDLASVK